MNLVQEDAEDAERKKKKKKSPCMLCDILLRELSSRIQFRSSLHEIFPRAEESLEKPTQGELAEQWVSSCTRLTTMSKFVVFGEPSALCTMPH